MSLYADFYEPSAVDPDTLVSACGDRAIIKIDARLSTREANKVAAYWCAERGYKAYQLLHGSSLLQATEWGPLVHVTPTKEVTP